VKRGREIRSENDSEGIQIAAPIESTYFDHDIPKVVEEDGLRITELSILITDKNRNYETLL